MRYNDLLGKKFTVTPDYPMAATSADNRDTKLYNGTFHVEDFQPYEPAAGITDEYYSIILDDKSVTNDNWESRCYTVIPIDLIKLVDPAQYNKMVELERKEVQREMEEMENGSSRTSTGV